MAKRPFSHYTARRSSASQRSRGKRGNGTEAAGALPAKVQEACLVQSMIGLYSEENTAYLRAAVTEHPTQVRQVKEERNDKERLKMSRVTEAPPLGSSESQPSFGGSESSGTG